MTLFLQFLQVLQQNPAATFNFSYRFNLRALVLHGLDPFPKTINQPIPVASYRSSERERQGQ
eukprot:gene18122-21622_t